MDRTHDAVVTAEAGRAAGGRSAEVAALVAAVGLGDSTVIGTLYDHGVRGGTVPALEWLPAVDVCWLDGADVAERHALRVQFAADDRSTPEGVECRAAIHWVDAATAVDAEVRLYDRLFTVEDPDAAEGGFLSVLNPDSVKTVTAKIEASLLNEAPDYSCQFERNGYFIADTKDHIAGKKAVFNRTVSLKDSWAKGR